ncbi:MAG TPA: hypothetical protein VFT47_11375 [Vicinamibacterales bacterium]|nr:hypothetical protein [Vicinamibacterales bacterium]
MFTNQNTSHEVAVRKLIDDWAAAVRAKDFAGILRHHSPEILMFDVPPPLQLRIVAKSVSTPLSSAGHRRQFRRALAAATRR